MKDAVVIDLHTGQPAKESAQLVPLQEIADELFALEQAITTE